MQNLQYRRNAKKSVMFVGGVKSSWDPAIVVKSQNSEHAIQIPDELNYYFKHLAGDYTFYILYFM